MSVSTNAIAVNRGSIIGTGWVTMWADSSIINYDNIRTATQGMHASTDSYAINHGAIVTTGSDDKEMQAHVRSNIANGGGDITTVSNPAMYAYDGSIATNYGNVSTGTAWVTIWANVTDLR